MEEDDYIVAIHEVSISSTPRDLRHRLDSFRHGGAPAVAGICGRCNKLHIDRDVTRKILSHCLQCASELSLSPPGCTSRRLPPMRPDPDMRGL